MTSRIQETTKGGACGRGSITTSLVSSRYPSCVCTPPPAAHSTLAVHDPLCLALPRTPRVLATTPCYSKDLPCRYERKLIKVLDELIREMDRKIAKAKDRAAAESSARPLKPDDAARLADMQAKAKGAANVRACLPVCCCCRSRRGPSSCGVWLSLSSGMS